jgi:hypothetical protein
MWNFALNPLPMKPTPSLLVVLKVSLEAELGYVAPATAELPE